MFATAAVLLSFGLSLSKFTSYFTGTIRADEQVILFPTVGRWCNATHMEVPVHGWIFEPEYQSKKRRTFQFLLRRTLGIQDSAQKRILKRRIRPFLVDNERWKTPRIRIDLHNGQEEQVYRMTASSKNGHFQKVLHVPVMTMEEDTCQSETERAHPTTTTISLEVVMDDDTDRHFEGRCHVLPETGLSIISDIDDTIKITNVTSTRMLLKSTFLEEFQPVPGMADLYAQWEQEYHAAFHFVSSSPWQLYPELELFRQKYHYPAASFHLKSVRPKDRTLFNLWADPMITKTVEMERLLNTFPNRTFVLVGDSGERDPEVYGALARNYPGRVAAILIRNVTMAAATEEEDDMNRYQAAFQDLPANMWKVFQDPKELQSVKLVPNVV